MVECLGSGRTSLSSHCPPRVLHIESSSGLPTSGLHMTGTSLSLTRTHRSRMTFQQRSWDFWRQGIVGKKKNSMMDHCIASPRGDIVYHMQEHDTLHKRFTSSTRSSAMLPGGQPRGSQVYRLASSLFLILLPFFLIDHTSWTTSHHPVSHSIDSIARISCIFAISAEDNRHRPTVCSQLHTVSTKSRRCTDVPNLALSSLVHGESPPLVARQSTIFVRYSL